MTLNLSGQAIAGEGAAIAFLYAFEPFGLFQVVLKLQDDDL